MFTNRTLHLALIANKRRAAGIYLGVIITVLLGAIVQDFPYHLGHDLPKVLSRGVSELWITDLVQIFCTVGKVQSALLQILSKIYIL